jgi:uroporphyrinogen decarboxylase
VTGAERLLAACRGEPVDATPVWFMRQAGGRLPRYLALRERHSVIEIARTPALCAEVTLAAVEALGVDGAVLYADIMLLVEAMGIELELTTAGPVLANPLRTRAAIDALRPVDPEADLGFVLEAIGRVRAELAGRAAVVGILGGPFTLAAYLVEGAPSRDQVGLRALMHGRPDDWHALAEALTIASVAYARAQVQAGADLVQLFDTWAASLTTAEYERFVAPYARRILAAVEVPTVHYVARSAAILDGLAATGPSVVGLDSRQSLVDARRRLGPKVAVQGNLDPALVAAGWGPTARGVDDVLTANGGRPGHVFNLGEAAPRDVDPSRLRDVAALVHDRTAGRRAPADRPEVPVDALA